MSEKTIQDKRMMKEETGTWNSTLHYEKDVNETASCETQFGEIAQVGEQNPGTLNIKHVVTPDSRKEKMFGTEEPSKFPCDGVLLTIPKHRIHPINFIYNTLRLKGELSEMEIKMNKIAEGLEIAINPTSIKCFIRTYLTNIFKSKRIVFSDETEFNTMFDINAIAINETKLLYLLINHLEKINSILETYSGRCYITNRCIKLVSDELCNQKVIVYKFNEIYNKIYLIEFEPMQASRDSSAAYSRLIRFNNMLIGETDDFKTVELDRIRMAKCSFEVDLETSGFLSGKKCGKTNKIMRETECGIEIAENSEWVKYTIRATQIQSIVSALELINEEYPSFLVFSVDYKHHKKIIGTSGRHIQRIMKKYDVYVKFMNEKEAELYPENVICKTPCKNIRNLKLIQDEILQEEGRSLSDYERADNVKAKKTSIMAEIPKLYELIIQKIKN